MDKNLENIINRVANRNSVTPKKAKMALEIFFRNAKGLMQRDDMPTIMMHGLGKFVPDENKIRTKLIGLKRGFVRKRMTEEYYEKEKDRFMAVLKTLQANKQHRNN